MKNSQTLIAIVVVVILFLVGFTFLKKTKTDPTVNKEISGQMIQDAGESAISNVSGTIEDLIAKNVPMECTYTSNVSGQESSGKVMVADNKMKGQFTTKAGGQEQTVTMIQDGEYMYSWSDVDKKGMKVKIDSIKDEVKKAKVEMAKDDSIAFAQQQADYSCKPWIVTSSTFTPPADVTFTDYSALMEQSNQMQDATQKAPCSVCSQIPAGSSRDECLKRLNC